MRYRILALMVLAHLGPSGAAGHALEAVFSGPQVGEKLPLFTMRGVFDSEAGKSIDLVSQAAGKPVLLVFVHETNRPSVALTRTVMTYAARRVGDGLVSGVVWLTDDPTATEQLLKRARHALPKGVPIGISMDGKEGPGAYGLNRNVTLTVLVARNNQVTANFALVQPSVQADAPKILAEIVKLIGGKAPTLRELEPRSERVSPKPDKPTGEKKATGQNEETSK